MDPIQKSAPHEKPFPGALADALFTSTQQKVLAVIFGQPERSFFVTEIMGKVNSGRGAVQRELERLWKSGLISETRVGNQKHYQANPESPLFDELRSIVRKTVGLKDPVRAALEPLAERIYLALIFGSVAKAADTAKSDIDLLVVADDLTLEETYGALDVAEKSLGREISPTLLTREEFQSRRARNAPFLKKVLDGATILLIGSIDEP